MEYFTQHRAYWRCGLHTIYIINRSGGYVMLALIYNKLLIFSNLVIFQVLLLLLLLSRVQRI